MKYIILLLLFFTFHCGMCQDGRLQLNEQKQVFYSDNVTRQKSRDELYKSAQNWIAKTFGNYDNAVTFQDPQSGKLVVNSYVPVVHSVYDHIRFDLTIQCQDNAYQATITNLDGISQIRTPARLGQKDNDRVAEKSVAAKSETNRKKRTKAEQQLQHIQTDNEAVNRAMFSILAGLKEGM